MRTIEEIERQIADICEVMKGPLNKGPMSPDAERMLLHLQRKDLREDWRDFVPPNLRNARDLSEA
jgi:hypothetical protein